MWLKAFLARLNVVLQNTYVIFVFRKFFLLPMLQSPGIDIMGVGLKSGEILLHNIKLDETIMKFYQDWGCVTFLSFRSGTAVFIILLH